MKIKKVRCLEYEDNIKPYEDKYCNCCGLKNMCKKGILDFSGWEFESIGE